MKQEQLFHAEVEIALSFNKFQNPENVTFVGVPKNNMTRSSWPCVLQTYVYTKACN